MPRIIHKLPSTLAAFFAAACVMAFAVECHAQFYQPPQGGAAADQKPAILQNVSLTQKLDSQAPLNATFRDENGNQVQLGQLLHGKPAILMLVYYQCPMLCTEVLNGVSTSIGMLKFNLGRDYNIISISIDPSETPAIAAAKKQKYIERYGRPGAAEGWHFLTGEKPAIDAVASAVGFRYAYDARSKQYAHPSTIMVLTPEGRVAQYFYGIEYAPSDLRLGMVDASQGKMGSLVDRALLFCYHYDATQGRYTPAVMVAVRAAGALTVVAMGLTVVMLFKIDRLKPRQPAGGSQA